MERRGSEAVLVQQIDAFFRKELDGVEIAVFGGEVDRGPAEGGILRLDVRAVLDQIFHDGEIAFLRGEMKRGHAFVGCGVADITRQELERDVVKIEDFLLALLFFAAGRGSGRIGIAFASVVFVFLLLVHLHVIFLKRLRGFQSQRGLQCGDLLFIRVIVELVLTAALVQEIFDERSVDCLDAGAVFDQETDFLQARILRGEMKRRFLLFRQLVRIAAEVEQGFHEFFIAAHDGVVNGRAALVVRQIDLGTPFDELFGEIHVALAADGVKKRHAVLFFDAVVGIAVEEPGRLLEEIVCGEIPCEDVGAERAVRFFSGLLFRGHDGAEFGQFRFPERRMLDQFVEPGLYGGDLRLCPKEY